MYILRTFPNSNMSNKSPRYWHVTDTWTYIKSDAYVFDTVDEAFAKKDILEEEQIGIGLKIDVIEPTEANTEVAIVRQGE